MSTLPNDKPTINFDEEGRVRVLEADKYHQTVELEQEARTFVQKITEFTDTVQTLVDNLQSQGNIIEKYKLKAIGQRNMVETEHEIRQQTIREMHACLEEKQTELQRLEQEYNSLLSIEQGQKEILEKLSNNEPG